MDDQTLEKVKECAVNYLGVKKDDIVSVSEIFNDDAAQGFDVRIQGGRLPASQRCTVVVKDGKASILSESNDAEAPGSSTV